MNKTSERPERIYVALEALLDTRLAVLASIDPEAANYNLINGYHTRKSDVFENIDMELYKKAYKERNKDILQYAVVTNAIRMLKDLVSQLIEQTIVRPYNDGVMIVINTYPFTLTENEKEGLANAVKGWISDSVQISIIDLPYKRITPELVNSTYSLMIMYEYEQWLNEHIEDMQVGAMTNIMLLAPAIYNNKVPTEIELTRLAKEGTDPFKATETVASVFIELRLIDIANFSIILPSS